MRKVLITKLASLGDLIHALPALSDAAKAIPDIAFDWVVDKNFSEIPLWHPSVQKTFLTNHRFWRSHLFAKQSRQEFTHLLRELKLEKYDLIIDAQGNLKSSILSLAAKGKRVGWDSSSVIEWGAHFLYKESYCVSKKEHAIERLRSLFAQALDYPIPNTPPDYCIDLLKLKTPNIDLPPSYVLFVPIASYDSKLWPEDHWKELIEKSTQQGLFILLPWGNAKEKERAMRLAIHPQVKVLPKLSLSEIAFIIKQAKGLVSVDTGLSHMAAALGTPGLTLYGPTDSKLTGTIGENQTWMKSPSSILADLSPSAVFEKFFAKIKK